VCLCERECVYAVLACSAERQVAGKEVAENKRKTCYFHWMTEREMERACRWRRVLTSLSFIVFQAFFFFKCI